MSRNVSDSRGQLFRGILVIVPKIRTHRPMTSAYRHDLLDTSPCEAAEHANAALLGPCTLGVEVTEPRLAGRCGLGNVDPQHQAGGGAVAAIEVAFGWPLPPLAARLVTIRPDADAYGAMAMFGLRAAGLSLDSAMRARTVAIARADRFDHGPWPGLRALPATAADIDEVGLGEQNLGGLAAGLNDRTLTAEAGVAATRDWIVSGVTPAPWRTRAACAAEVLFNALDAGQVRLTALDPGSIALVEGCVPGALRLGYRIAPVVIALEEAEGGAELMPWRRMAVAQWKTGYVNLALAATLLGAEEPGWGGSCSIIASPQGSSCHTTTSRVLAVLRKCGMRERETRS